MKTLTQERLKELLHYEPETGVFEWREYRRGMRPDRVAGSPNSKGYLLIKIDYNSHRAHRLAFLYMTGKLPTEQVDHINHNRADNRWDNLRLVCNAENHRNCSMYSHNTSGVTGVFWYKPLNKWQAGVMVDQKHHHIGFFDNLLDAVAARKRAEREFGFHENHGLAA
jgi:hypothetical protein